MFARQTNLPAGRRAKVANGNLKKCPVSQRCWILHVHLNLNVNVSGTKVRGSFYTGTERSRVAAWLSTVNAGFR